MEFQQPGTIILSSAVKPGSWTFSIIRFYSNLKSQSPSRGIFVIAQSESDAKMAANEIKVCFFIVRFF
jgi:hypothetical protein